MQLENDSIISLESLELNSLSDANEIMEYIVKRMPRKKSNFKQKAKEYPQKQFQVEKNTFKPIRQDIPKIYEVKNRNLYSPLEIRGEGINREGKCPYCLCFLKMKTSNFWYHMNFTHGINSKGIKYPSPILLDCELGKYLRCPQCSLKIKFNKGKQSLTYSTYYKHYHSEHRI